MTGHVAALIFVCVLLAIVLILHIICLATPYYAATENLGSSLADINDIYSYNTYYPNMDTSYGYWKICMRVYNETVCYNFGLSDDSGSMTVHAPDWLIACQALSIVGVILGALGVVVTLIWLCVASTSFIVIGSISAICGGIVIIVADIIFAVEKSMKFIFSAQQISVMFDSPEEKYIMAADKSYDYSWGFNLDLASGIACVLLGFVLLVCACLVRRGTLDISKSSVI